MTERRVAPRKALNKAFLKVKPHRAEIERFKRNLVRLLDRANGTESEEFHKNLVADFLKETYYHPAFYINTKGRNDLVIHTGPETSRPVGVLIEAKKPTNKAEMPTQQRLNTKALHELLLYFLRERITHRNLEMKHLVVTNTREWFLFDAALFERLFAQHKGLVHQFQEFEAGRLADSRTEFFYTHIAEPHIALVEEELVYTHFHLDAYEKVLRNADRSDDAPLIALYKLLSPEHLLKLPFANDSNSLDKRFYSELLHILGLTETKEGSKKLIQRPTAGNRLSGSLLEDTIIQLDSLDKLSRLPHPAQYGSTTEERLFAVALELCITWVNRILFLKLLEAQLLAYHRGNPAYAFLNAETLSSYDDLNSLFFQVLARRADERNEDVRAAFQNVPYLNSSLFEPTELEHLTLFISNLRDDKTLPISPLTVLKDEHGKKRTGALPTLAYLFAFLNAYDFSSEGAEDIQEDNKTLINASVLGLIFEKINGYKDGSFFTPGFITMYMCRETIRKAVVQKFNETKGWTCETLDDVYNRVEDRNEANAIVNSVKICDPAVGSGHFLVSALNELIAVKNDLKILHDRSGKRLKEYHVEVVNDELIVTDEDGDLFDYNPLSKESQRVQEALFHEKQTLIEQCLFGVDINPNSVKICRLRLWIELLKHAYYKNATELETLPNIDINIKCGNSLVSRFPLDADLKQVLKKKKWSIDSYRAAVSTYRNATQKTEKRAMERLIGEIKTDFRSEIAQNDPLLRKLRKAEGELFHLTNQGSLFSLGKKEHAEWEKKTRALSAEIERLQDEIDAVKANAIFEHAFEWRFEFPDVLNDDGDFVGFDVVIGNPPYIRQEEFTDIKSYLKNNFILYSGTADIYIYFIEKGFKILKEKGLFAYILPNKFMQAGYGQLSRGFLTKMRLFDIIDFGDIQIFDDATTYPCIIIASKCSPSNSIRVTTIKKTGFADNFIDFINTNSIKLQYDSISDSTWIISNSKDQDLLNKLFSRSIKLESYINEMAKYGIKTGLSEAFVISEDMAKTLIQKDNGYLNHLFPFLLGRETKPYTTGKPSNYLIKFEKGFTNRHGGNNPKDWFIYNFPDIYFHLSKFSDKAEKRSDKGDFYWELRSCDYYDKFNKPKIMYQSFQVKPCFIFDKSGLYCNNSMWFIPTEDMALLGILNSKMGWWLISKYCTAIQNGYQLIWKYFSQIPIATGNEPVRSSISNLVDIIINTKHETSSADTTALEREIDHLVYQLYGLTDEEIALVERSVG